MSTFGNIIDRGKRGIQLRTWQEFSEGLPVSIVPHEKTDFPKEIIHQRALARIGQYGYDMIFQNCEHFVSWCRNNKVFSRQLNNAFLFIVLIGILIAVFRSDKKKYFV